MSDDHVSVEQAAEIAEVSEQTIRSALRSGDLEGFKQGGQWLVDRDDLADWIADELVDDDENDED